MSDEENIELNQEKEINLEIEEKNENEEKEEREEKDEKDDKESSQGEQEIQKEEIKEEKIEIAEDHLDNQEPQETPEPEPEIIIFSTLSKEEKIKYFNYFIANDTTFNREEEGTWIAEIEILDEAKPEPKSNDNLLLSTNSSDLKNLRQSKFRSTKKDYDTIYSTLISVINPPAGIKGTKMDINAIKYMIQEIYSLKFLKDTQALLSKEEKEPESFPIFVGNFLLNKFSKKDMLYKKSIDFMLSLDFYGMKHRDIKIFQQFVTEEYDSDDLIFYLFVRSCIEKEQKQFFLERAKENLGQGLLYGQEDDDILVPVKKCKKLAKAIFGSDEEELMNKFMENIQTLVENEAADDKKKYLKANSILNMALVKYHESRDKVDEEDKEEEKSKEEEQEEVEEKDKQKEKKITLKEKPKTILKKKKVKEEEIKVDQEPEEEEKTKLTTKNICQKVTIKNEKEKEEDSEDSQKVEYNIDQIEESPPTIIKSKKKGNVKPSTTSSNPKPKVNVATKTNNPVTKQSKTTIKKPTNTIKVPHANKTTVGTKAPKNTISKSTVQNSQIKTSRPGLFSNSKLNSNTTSKPVRQTSSETRGTKLKTGNRTKGNSSVGKRPVKKTVHNFDLDEKKIEQTPEFKKILNKNRIEKVKLENEKAACLCYIINDYFKLKELDAYFKNIIEKNPIFQPLSAKIYANLKNPKEFLLKKLNGICKYISIGDKNGFYNFLKIKDKNGKSNFEGFKSSFTALLKGGPLKDLNETDISNFCKSLLEMPELSFQTSKTLLKLCE